MKPAPLPANEAERLRILQELRLGEAGITSALAAIARLAGSQSGWPIGAIGLVGEYRQWFAAAPGRALPETPREFSFCAHALAIDGAFEVVDAASDERFADSPLVTGVPHVRA